MRKFLSLILALLLTLSACAESGAALGFLTGGRETEKWLKESLQGGVSSGMDHTILALTAIDRDTVLLSGYGEKLASTLKEKKENNHATALLHALTLAACGEDEKLISELLDENAGKGIMSDVYALFVMQNGYAGSVSEEDIRKEILSLRLPDGGWAISGKVSDSDTTAMVLQALAAYEDAETAEAKQKALLLLSSMQTENGGFKSYGAENCESACQVAIALTSMGIDPLTDERFIKNGHTVLDAIAFYKLENGAYSHLQNGKENTMATRQALLAHAAYEKYVRGEGALYRFEKAESKARSLKFYLNIGLAALCVIVLAVMFLMGRRRPATYLCVALLFAVGFTLINVLDIQGVDEYYKAPEPEDKLAGTVSAEIRCDNLIGIAENIPEDGSIFTLRSVDLYEGDTAASVLRRICKTEQLQLDMDNSMSCYVKGIVYLYELQYGPLSGWVYKVNGEQPSVGCGEYELRDGDTLSFLYTLDLGEDCN